MRLREKKLVFYPQLFVENPRLIREVLKTEITQTHDPHPNFRKLYTKCTCPIGYFYWQELRVDGHPVEVFACGICENWSMSVTY